MRITPLELRECLQRDLPQAIVGALVLSSASSEIADTAACDVVIEPTSVPAVARYMRDALSYELLSNITAVDYLADAYIELVYHFVNVNAGGAPLVIKTRVPRDNAVVPSLTSDWPGADLQEREAFDLYGVQFPGHPNLRRVYMWDEFEGWPMRKDFPKQGDKYFKE